MISLQSIISLLNAASGVLGGCTKSTYCFEQVMGARAVSFYIHQCNSKNGISAVIISIYPFSSWCKAIQTGIAQVMREMLNLL